MEVLKFTIVGCGRIFNKHHEGRKSLELINEIYESSETAREVFLRFMPKKSKLGG